MVYLNGSGTATPPSPDADGANSNVAKLETFMNGSFAAKTGASAQNFSLSFRIMVE